MTRSWIPTARRVVGPLLFLLGALLVAESSVAEILSAELQVNGLSCPFCAFGIEKKLQRVDGVREVEVLLDEGRIVVGFAEGNRATVRDLDEAVEKAGFELASLHLSVRGRFPDPETARFEVHPGLVLRVAARAEGDGQGGLKTQRRSGENGAEGFGRSESRILSGRVEERDALEPELIPDVARSSDAEQAG